MNSGPFVLEGGLGVEGVVYQEEKEREREGPSERDPESPISPV